MKKQKISLVKNTKEVKYLSASHQRTLIGGKSDGKEAAKYVIIEDDLVL